MNFSSITSSLTQSAKSMNSLATKISTHLQNQFGSTIDGIKDSLDVLKAGQDMVSTVVHDVTGQDVNIRSIQKGAADFDEKWDAFVNEINSKFNTASPNSQADIMETFVKSHFGGDVYNLGSAIKNELPNVLDGIADYQETINSIGSDSKTVEEAATKINNGVEKMVKATEKIASSINNAVEICTGKGIPILDELSKIGSSADVVNLNKALNIGMTGAKAATAANQLKQSIKNKDLRGITDAMAKGATSVNSLMSQLQQIVPGFPNAQIPVKITDSIKRLQNAQSVYDAAGSMVTALVADASGRHDLSSFATLASNFNQNWDTFSSKIDALFNIVPANGQQAVLETLAKNMFGENVFYAAGAIKRQTPGFLSGLAGVQDAIKQLGGSYRNPIEAVTKIRNCTEKIVQSVEKIGQSLNNMVKYYQGKGDITKGTGYPLLEMMGNLGDTKGIKALDYVLRTAGGTAAIVGNAGAVAQAIKNKDIPGAIAAVKKTIDDFKNLTKKGNYKAQGNDKGALPKKNNNKSSSPPNEQQGKQKSQLSSGQTDSYVCSGATMRCTMGTSQAKLTVLPTRTVYLTGQPMANISDHLSMVNLAPFGNCRSMGFPATASATAAAQGTLTPMPCMHNTPFPWMGGKNDYIIKGDPALLKSSTCQCMWGGTISLITDGQTDTGPADLSRKPKDDFRFERIKVDVIPSGNGHYAIAGAEKHLEYLKNITPNDLKGIPESWINSYNDSIQRINEKYQNEGIESAYSDIEHAYSISELVKNEKAKKFGLENISDMMPFQMFDIAEKIPGFVEKMPKKEFWDSFKTFVPLYTDAEDGAFFSPTYGYVNISMNDEDNIYRMSNSDWYKAGLIHHEFGHAQDHLRDWSSSKEFDEVFKEFQKEVVEDNVENKLNKLIREYQEEGKYTDEVQEKIGALSDSIQAALQAQGIERVVPPRGHFTWHEDTQTYTFEYFNNDSLRMAEFIAHSSENYWSENDLFKSVCPKTYEKMREVVKNSLYPNP